LQKVERDYKVHVTRTLISTN